MEKKEPTLEATIEFATSVHEGQFRWDRKTPYITHPLKVMELVKENFKKFHLPEDIYLDAALKVAVLHDVVEDTNVTLEELELMGYRRIVVKGVESVTEKEGDSYLDKIMRAKKHTLGRIVKYCDITHNMSDLDRKKKKQMYDKYEVSKALLIR